MRRSFGWITLALGVLVVLTCMGFGAPIDLLVAITLGWLWYLARTFPQIQVAWTGVATAVVCLILFAVGSHAFLGWLYPHASRPKQTQDAANPRWKWRWTGSIVAVTILMFVAGMSTVGVTHQLGWLLTSKERLFSADGGARDAARRAQSVNNLKQIGLALHSYQQAYHSFPPGGTFDRTGRPMQSWQAMILPYIELEGLHRQIHFDVPWNDSHNTQVFQTEVMTYLHPGITLNKNAAGFALSHYSANVHMLGGNHPRALGDVTDGTAVTLMAGEVVSDFKPWGDPTNWRDPSLGLNKSPRGFGSPSPGGANFLMVDGSARFIKNSIDPKVLKALATPAGGEKIQSEGF